MPSTSGSPTQIATSADTKAELSGDPVDQFKSGDLGWVQSELAQPHGPLYALAKASGPPVNGTTVLAVFEQPTMRWVSLSLFYGADLAIVPNRRDHSVNGAWVDYWENAHPVMRVQTNVNPAGGYSGGGTGNKATLGYYLPGPPYPAGGTMKLSDLASVEYTIDRISPEVSAVNDIAPYVNLLVLLNPLAPPAARIFVVMVFGDWGNAVPTGVFTPTFPPNPPVSGPGPNPIHVLWTPANLVLVVNFEGMSGPPAVGLWPVIVPKSFGPPGDPTGLLGGGAWPGSGYKISDILAVYPDAIIHNWAQTALQNDGGLPKLTTVSGITLNLGSSGNFAQSAVRVLDWKINGASV